MPPRTGTASPGRAPGRALAAALGALLALAASTAGAQAEIRSVRLGRHRDYDRVVFELGPQPVPVFQVEGPDLGLEFEAAAPPMQPNLQRKLAALGVDVEATADGTRIEIDVRGRASLLYRLSGDAYAGAGSGRVVLDLAKGRAPLETPAGAEGLPVRAARLAASPAIALPAVDSPPPTRSARIGSRPRGAARSAAPQPEPEEPFRFLMRSVEFEGLPAKGPTREQLLDLELRVRIADNGDWLAPRGALPAATIRLREITSDERSPHRVSRSLLQQVVERIADAYEESGKYGTHVDIRAEDLQQLLEGAESLTIHIAEASE